MLGRDLADTAQKVRGQSNRTVNAAYSRAHKYNESAFQDEWSQASTSLEEKGESDGRRRLVVEQCASPAQPSLPGDLLLPFSLVAIPVAVLGYFFCRKRCKREQ